MKNIIIIVVIILAAWGIYSYTTEEEIPPQNTPMAKWVNSYDAIITKYEKTGVKNQMDILKLTSDIQSLSTTNPGTTNISPSEAKFYQNKIKDLQNRQIKLIQGR